MWFPACPGTFPTYAYRIPASIARARARSSVATGVGGMLAISPAIFVLAAPVFFIIIGVTRYVSLGSLLGTAFGAGLVVVSIALGWLEAAWLLYVVPGLAIIWFAHRDNIGRLLDGTERRFDPMDRSTTPVKDEQGQDPESADINDPPRS